LFKFVQCDDLQTSLHNCQPLDRHVAREEELDANGGVSRYGVAGTEPAENQFEALRRQIIADLFMNFPLDTVEEALIAFPTTPKKTDLSWILNVRNVVAQLQEKATIGVEKYCRGAFFHFWVQRSVTSLQ